MPVDAPYEILDLADGEERTFTVLSVDRGELTFRPRGEVRDITVPAMRLYVEPSEKVLGLPYYDVTSRTLQAQLWPHLSDPAALPRRVRIRKIGAAPAARFTVGFAPVGSGVSA